MIRVNITLPRETLDLINRVSETSRSAFINEAVLYYGTRLEKANLKKRLKSRYSSYADEDLDMSRDWAGNLE